jgi:hypothetical protein
MEDEGQRQRTGAPRKDGGGKTDRERKERKVVDRKLERAHEDSGTLKPNLPVSPADQAHVDARQRDPEGEYETVERAEAQIERQQREIARSPNVGGPDWVPDADEVDPKPDDR